MSRAPAQLVDVADRTSAALQQIFAEEIDTWRALDPSIERPLQDLADFIAGRVLALLGVRTSIVEPWEG